MGEAKQEILTFDAGLQASYGSASDKLHAICRSVIKRAEVKQGDDVAASLGIAPAHLSEALSGRGIKHFSLRWLPAVLHLDRDRELLNYAAALVGCKVVEREPLSDKQKLDLLRAELRDSGADIDAIEDRAWRRAP